jgi:hypothetical protein
MREPARVWLVAYATVAVLGCSPSGVRYSGVVADPVALPGQVRQVVDLPGATELGSVEARCVVPSRSLEDGISYGDLACSADLMREALVQTAAHVGGTHLVDVRCSGDAEAHLCEGRVVVAPGARGRLPERPAPFERFRVEVVLLPSEGAAVHTRGMRVPDMVPRLPVSDRFIGEVAAECDGTCNDALARDAVAAGAGYAGAQHYGYASCRDEEGRPASGAVSGCQSWASAYEIHVGTRK